MTTTTRTTLNWQILLLSAIAEEWQYTEPDVPRALEEVLNENLTPRDVKVYFDEHEFSENVLNAHDALHNIDPEAEMHIWGRADEKPADCSVTLSETFGEANFPLSAFYDFDGAKAHAEEHMPDNQSITTMRYPVGIVPTAWHDDEPTEWNVATLDLTVERFDPEIVDWVNDNSPRAYLEGPSADPEGTFVKGDGGDYGSAFWERTLFVWHATYDDTLTALLYTACIPFEIVDVGGDLHFYFADNESTRARAEKVVRKEYRNLYNDLTDGERARMADPDTATVSEMCDSVY